jgi:hypothetical protein
MPTLLIRIELNWFGVIVMAFMFAALEYGLYCIAQKCGTITGLKS